MLKEFSLNQPCPCHSGRKYKLCCRKDGLQWQLDPAGNVTKVESRPPEFIVYMTTMQHECAAEFRDLPFPPPAQSSPARRELERFIQLELADGCLDLAKLYAQVKTGFTEDAVRRAPERLGPAWAWALNQFRAAEAELRRELGDAPTPALVCEALARVAGPASFFGLLSMVEARFGSVEQATKVDSRLRSVLRGEMAPAPRARRANLPRRADLTSGRARAPR